jgi:hypothetical protein
VQDDWYGWLLAISRTVAWDHRVSWTQSFRDAGARQFVAIEPTLFDPDGQMYAQRRPTGRWRFVDVAEAQAAFGDRDWFRLEAPCAWVGAVEGFLNCEWWTELDDRMFDIERFLGASKGYVARLRDDRSFDAIAQNCYRLADAHAKHGFGDGDDLPDLGPGYDAYVWDEVAKALAELGLRAEKITYGTSHNRIRFDDLVPDRHIPLRDAWGVFAAHRDDPLVLWACNNRRDELKAIMED